MLSENLIFLQVVPSNQYFQWQIEVQIVNFRKFGVSNKMHICVWYPKGSQDILPWKTIQEKYPEVRIFIYEDSGVDLGLYISQLRPHTLKKHFEEQEELLNGKTFFYHDSDIIFNTLPDFASLLQDESINWQSDCSGYLDYNYLRSKEIQGNIPEDEAVKIFAEIGNISVDLIKSYTGKTGGAQSILRNIDSEFWSDVERQCLEIRRKFRHSCEGGLPDTVNSKYFKSENGLTGEQNGFQSWCADMWALNFAQWSRGMVTDVTPLLDFSWANDDIETFNKKPIFHNAGASSQNPNIFYKGAYINKSPLYDRTLPYDKTTASSKYVEAIWEVK